jgi:hypothetical protein
MSVRVFHYTTMEKLGKILDSRSIFTATGYVPKNERPVVWFSTNPVWEETANKGIMDALGRISDGSREKTHKGAGGLARIEVPESITVNWLTFKLESGIKPVLAKRLARIAKKQNSKPSEWRVSFTSVPESEWISLELFNWEKQFWEPQTYTRDPSGKGGTIDRIVK